MGNRSRIRRLGLITAVLTAVGVLVAPQAALAATLIDGTIYRPKVSASYDLATSKRGWSAVALYSPYNWNVSLFRGSLEWLASSTYPAGKTEFIAINSVDLPLDTYRATADRLTGYGPYVQWRQAAEKVVLPVPANDGVTGPSDPDITFAVLRSEDVVSVANIYLNAGESFWVNSTPDRLFYFLETNPYEPSTAVVTRARAVRVPGMRIVGNCTLYRANYTGWHGLLMVSDAAPITTVPGSGKAVVLHRFDPARPNTCPQRNFPDPTPPGA